MAESKTPQRLSRLSQCYLGGIPGGVPVAVMVACAFFTAFTGASGVTIIALGGLFYPLLLKEKYSKDFSLGLMTSSGSLGLLFPPSLPLILYGCDRSGEYQRVVSRRDRSRPADDRYTRPVQHVDEREVQNHKSSFRYQASAFRPAGGRLGGAPALHHCIGNLLRRVYGDRGGGGNGGLCPHHRILDLQGYSSRTGPAKTDDQQYGSGRHHLIILGTAMGFTSYLVDEQVPMQVLDFMKQYIDNQLTFLIVLNVLLLIVGCMMEIFSALIVIVPLIVPIAKSFDVNMVHLGIIFLTNLEIGYSTPPVGINLFIASSRFSEPVLRLYRATLPFLGLRLAGLLIITYFPALSLFLVDLFQR